MHVHVSPPHRPYPGWRGRGGGRGRRALQNHIFSSSFLLIIAMVEDGHAPTCSLLLLPSHLGGGGGDGCRRGCLVCHPPAPSSPSFIPPSARSCSFRFFSGSEAAGKQNFTDLRTFSLRNTEFRSWFTTSCLWFHSCMFEYVGIKVLFYYKNTKLFPCFKSVLCVCSF